MTSSNQSFIIYKRKKIHFFPFFLETYQKNPNIYKKEKYGTLRFYTVSHHDKQDGMITLAETLSGCICEQCVSMKDVTATQGGITMLCAECHIKAQTYHERLRGPRLGYNQRKKLKRIK